MSSTSITIKDATVITKILKDLSLVRTSLRDVEKFAASEHGDESYQVMNIQHDITEITNMLMLFSPRYKNSAVTLDYCTLIQLEEFINIDIKTYHD